MARDRQILVDSQWSRAVHVLRTFHVFKHLLSDEMNGPFLCL